MWFFLGLVWTMQKPLQLKFAIEFFLLSTELPQFWQKLLRSSPLVITRQNSSIFFFLFLLDTCWVKTRWWSNFIDPPTSFACKALHISEQIEKEKFKLHLNSSACRENIKYLKSSIDLEEPFNLFLPNHQVKTWHKSYYYRQEKTKYPGKS